MRRYTSIDGLGSPPLEPVTIEHRHTCMICGGPMPIVYVSGADCETDRRLRFGTRDGFRPRTLEQQIGHLGHVRCERCSPPGFFACVFVRSRAPEGTVDA